jgi:hypothetical protein
LIVCDRPLTTSVLAITAADHVLRDRPSSADALLSQTRPD